MLSYLQAVGCRDLDAAFVMRISFLNCCLMVSMSTPPMILSRGPADYPGRFCPPPVPVLNMTDTSNSADIYLMLLFVVANRCIFLPQASEVWDHNKSIAFVTLTMRLAGIDALPHRGLDFWCRCSDARLGRNGWFAHLFSLIAFSLNLMTLPRTCPLLDNDCEEGRMFYFELCVLWVELLLKQSLLHDWY